MLQLRYLQRVWELPKRMNFSKVQTFCSLNLIHPEIKPFFAKTESEICHNLNLKHKTKFKITAQINAFCTAAQDNNSNEHKVAVDGFNLNVREEGEGAHVILCLPGLMGSIETDFDKIFTEIDKSTFRLVCWDPPGYGKSRPPRRIHKPDYYLTDAKLAAKLMKKLGYEKYSILGWSNGGMTGLSLAATFPESVTKFIMWGSRARIDENCLKWSAFLSDPENWFEETRNRYLKAHNYDKLYFKTMLKNWYEAVNKHYISGDEEYRKRCTAVKCPTLVFRGNLDRLPIDNVHYFENNIKDCKVAHFATGGHDLHLTHTQEFLKSVYNFLLT